MKNQGYLLGVLILAFMLSFSEGLAKDYFQYGLKFSVPDEMNFNEYSNANEIYKLSNSDYLLKLSVSLVIKERLKHVLPEEKVTSTDRKFKTDINPMLFSKPYESHYFGYRSNRNKYIESFLVFDYSPLLDLVFSVKSLEKNFDADLSTLEKMIASTVDAKDPNQNGRIAADNVKGFEFKNHLINQADFLVSFHGMSIRMCNGINNELLLIWKDVSGNHHLNRLSKEGILLEDINFGKTAIYDVIAHNEGFAVLTSKPNLNPKASRYTSSLNYHHLYLEKFAWDQTPIFSTHLMGVDDIEKVGDQRFAYWGNASTRLAWSGEYYAAHFATYRKWPDRVTHQADAFLILDAKGALQNEKEGLKDNSCTWCVSHSFAQEMIYDGEKFVRFSLGDAYPRAIATERSYPSFSGNSDVSSGQFDKYPGKTGDNYVYDTHFGNIISFGEYNYFVYDTELKVHGTKTGGNYDKRCNDLFLKGMDHDSKPTGTFRLSNSSKIEERFASIAMVDSAKVLVKWQEYLPKTPDGKHSPYDGMVSEMIGVYNLETKKWEKKTKLKWVEDSDIISSYSLSDEGEHYYPNHGPKGQLHSPSPLFQDNEGRVWCVKFFANRGGYELIEVL